MCEKCEKLLNVPSNKKATVILNSSDSIGAKVDETIMQLNHKDNGTPYVFITHTLVLDNDRTYSHPIDIKYCPFCGEQLIK
jgi:hypothetical protein